jgi:hypothetical protein
MKKIKSFFFFEKKKTRRIISKENKKQLLTPHSSFSFWNKRRKEKARKPKLSYVLRRLRLHATFGRAAEGGIPERNQEKSWKTN